MNYSLGGERKIKIALAGNPNSGKTTLFNVLTGLEQVVGNYPGVTVDKKTGKCSLKINGEETEAEIIDLPGSYSLKAKSEDEIISQTILCNPKNEDYPDLVVYVADSSNLKRSLFYCTQIMELGIPLVLGLNMTDVAEKKKIDTNVALLEQELNLPVVPLVARKGKGIDKLKNAIIENISKESTEAKPVKEITEGILKRYERIDEILTKTTIVNTTDALSFTHKLDNLLVHRVWGLLIFLGILLLIFQAIFSWSELPMFWIEEGFGWLIGFVQANMPASMFTDLLANGILAGISGVVIFVPQIALLFLFISIMEDTGYMARVSLMLDKVMRVFGLNGRSTVPLMSGMACAIPAVMSARTISNWKERMITIMVTPLMSCSARLPVYALLIALIIPEKDVAGVFNLKGLVLMGLYLFGFLMAMIVAWGMKQLIKQKGNSHFIMEMPDYRSPRWLNIGMVILRKTRVFVVDAGKIIIIISILLWVLASFGPPAEFNRIERKYASISERENIPQQEIEAQMAAEKLEASFAGILGKTIEPVIEPLGYDWKIGIALVTSFAAREVFVGTMATIYSIGDEENTDSIREKMRAEVRPSGERRYNFATGISLMLFYALAMQCMSTLAIVYRETKHWKWPAIQLVYMTSLAYLVSLIAYQLLK